MIFTINKICLDTKPFEIDANLNISEKVQIDLDINRLKRYQFKQDFVNILDFSDTNLLKKYQFRQDILNSLDFSGHKPFEIDFINLNILF